MTKSGTGCLCCLQGSWSSLLEGQLEGRGVGSAGVRLAVQTPFMAETGELSRPGESCTFLVLCPQNLLFSSSSQLGRPPETVNEVWDLLVSMPVTSKQSVRRNQSWSDFVITPVLGCLPNWTRIQSHSYSDKLKTDILSMDLRNL